ncbi:MAG: T9SS type A sorting domain-containing protein [Candidatus Krumholzibacteriota bacterium]|nr:T9SS type A sorting domain-containing protein [Candidatus Krumholzibacteriota bacterium]
MNTRHRSLIAVVALLVLAGVLAVQAAWQDDGIPVCDEDTGDQSGPQIISDGEGGAVIVWQDFRTTGEGIYVERVDWDGRLMWGSGDGIAVCATGNSAGSPEIIPDIPGGAIVTWVDHRGIGHHIYAQKIDPNGNSEWILNGVAVCEYASLKYFPQLTTDGAGGVIITWWDNRNGNDDIFAERIDESGNVLWNSPNGVAICNASGHQDYQQIVSDGAGGAIIVWQDDRGIDRDIYAQRVHPNGAVCWTANGIAVCDAVNSQHDPQLVSDGCGGAIITWTDSRTGHPDIYAERIDSLGNSMWGDTNGVAVCTAGENQVSPQIINDGEGGVIITWADNRTEWDIYAQKIDTTGVIQWTGGGIAVCAATGPQSSPELTSDHNGGAAVTWTDQRDGDYDIYANLVDRNGTVTYPEGIDICTQDNMQSEQKIAMDDGYKAIIAWTDGRNLNNDIYAMTLGHMRSDYFVKGRSVIRDWTHAEFRTENEYRRGEVDTFTTVYYDFEISDWQGWTREDNSYSYGRYSTLQSYLLDKDLCGRNYSTQVQFFGSPGHSGPASTDYPGLYVTPYPLTVEGPFQNEMIVSPVIDMTRYSTQGDDEQDGIIPPGILPDLGGTQLNFTIYRDLDLPDLVFYYWRVRKIISGEPGEWSDRNFLYYGSGRDYQYASFDISDLVGDDPIQVAIGVIDAGGTKFAVYGAGSSHTPSPWIDNVHIKRYGSSGPQWSYRSIDLFQDNFPAGSVGSSFVRADMAMDINSPGDSIRPGDSIVVSVTSPAGIKTAVNGEPEVWMFIKGYWRGPGELYPDELDCTDYDPRMASDPDRCDSCCCADCAEAGSWTKLQGRWARGADGEADSAKVCFDLQDQRLENGWEFWYYFQAEDWTGRITTLPPWVGEEDRGPYFEFTTLPTLEYDVLYVDDFDGRGSLSGFSEHYWEESFIEVLSVTYSDFPYDRFDINGPSSLVSNGLGSRARPEHLGIYKKIVWDSGDLRYGTICDGTGGDKSEDIQLLFEYLESSPHEVGLWICGDNIAYDLNRRSPTSLDFMNTQCGVSLISDSYYQLSGGTVSPRIMGLDPPGIFSTADTLYAFGGCPIINDFDVLEMTEPYGEFALDYIDYTGLGAAGVQSEWTNGLGHPARTMWFAFSFMHIRDCDSNSPLIRNTIMEKVISWMNNETRGDITDADPDTPQAYKYYLQQNYPNPFNPVTTIRFGLKRKGQVTLRIYDVSGRLVKILVEGVRDAGPHTITWNGLNEKGAEAASGVYFYRLETKDFVQTHKMVILK